MFNKKGFKTTVIAIIGLVAGVATLIAWFTGAVDNEGLAIGLSSVGAFVTTIGLMFAKDSDQSHTKE